MRNHLPSFAGLVFVVGLLPEMARAQRVASAGPPAFAAEVLRTDSITPNSAATSPDGRWIVLSGSVRQQSSLWIMPSGGGAPRRLTSAVNDAWGPVWFPSSDRIAYVSSASSTVITQAIDPGTGSAQGAPRRVSLDGAFALDVSPDGSLIAYTTPRWSDGKARLKVVPARGGPARVILDAPFFRYQPRFAPDGQSIYVTVVSADRKPSQLFRVPVRGGKMTVVLEEPWSSGPMQWVGANLALLHGRNHLSAVTLSGDTLWSIPSPRLSRTTRLASDGKSMLLLTSETDASIRLVPLNGGMSRVITPGNSYDYPAGWSVDGQRIFIERWHPAEKGLWSVSVDGQHREFIPFPADSAWSGAHGSPRVIGDGRVWVSPHVGSAIDGHLSVYDTKTRTLHTVAHSAGLKEVNGPGGYWTGVPDLYYLDRGAEGIELRSLRGDGQLRTVRRLSFDLPTNATVSFANDRLAYWVAAGDSAVLYIADHDRTPKRVYAFRGSVMESSLSFDGTALAATTLSGPAHGSALTYVTLLGITLSGDLAGAPRSIKTSPVWDLMWLRDNHSLLALEDVDNSLSTRVVKFSLDAKRPVNVTAGEPMTFWDQYPSPDSRWTALPVEKARGGTIWRVDLEAAAKAWQERKRK